MVIDETKRLIIREIEALEALEASAFFSDFYRDSSYTEEMTEAYIKNAYGFYGYGYWGLFEKETGQMVGLAGFREGSCPLEVGYIIAEEHRNKGYAREAVKSLVEFAEEDFLWVLDEEPVGEKVTADILMTYEKNGKVLLYGRIAKENIASYKVLLNNGFKESKGFIR